MMNPSSVLASESLFVEMVWQLSCLFTITNSLNFFLYLHHSHDTSHSLPNYDVKITCLFEFMHHYLRSCNLIITSSNWPKFLHHSPLLLACSCLPCVLLYNNLVFCLDYLILVKRCM